MPESTLARDIMTTEVTTFSPDDDLLAAARVLFDNRWQGAPVMDGERLVGVITLGDVIGLQRSVKAPSAIPLLDALIYIGLRRFEKEMKEVTAMTVGDAMTSPAVSVSPTDKVSEVASKMVDVGITTVPVVEDGALVGVVGRRDIVALILGTVP